MAIGILSSSSTSVGNCIFRFCKSPLAIIVLAAALTYTGIFVYQCRFSAAKKPAPAGLQNLAFVTQQNTLHDIQQNPPPAIQQVFEPGVYNASKHHENKQDKINASTVDIPQTDTQKGIGLNNPISEDTTDEAIAAYQAIMEERDSLIQYAYTLYTND